MQTDVHQRDRQGVSARGATAARPAFFVAGARVAVAVLIVAAVVAQYAHSVHFWHHVGVTSIPGKTLDFLLFFTEDSNIATAVVLVVGAVRTSRRLAPTVRWTTVRLTVTVCMIVTGVADGVLLRGLPKVPGSVLPWADDVLHIVAPVIVLVDWFVGPDRVRLRPAARLVGIVAAGPVVWLAVTLLRGPFTGDQASDAVHYYPYGFLDPDTSRYGYGSVAAYVVALFVFLTVAVLLLAWSTRTAPLLAWATRPRARRS